MSNRRKRKLEQTQHERIVIQSRGEFSIKRTDSIYELNLETGMILLAPLDRLADRDEKQVFKIQSEKPMHLYMPALNKDAAKIKFNSILNLVKAKKK